jgi:hypothetical protein
VTRRDYVLIAAALRLARPTHTEPGDGWRSAVDAMADALVAANPRFDRELFLANCGVSS